MKKSKWLLIPAGTLLLLAIAAAILLAPIFGGPGAGEPQIVDIPNGMPLRAVATLLQEKGILDEAWHLRAAARLWPGRSIKAGRYELRAGSSASEILRVLDLGQGIPSVLTVPEGFRVAQIASTAGEALDIAPRDFLEICQKPSAKLRALCSVPETATLEGYLLPDTYHFAHGTTATAVVEAMLRANAALMDTLRLPDGFDRHQLLTLASIVEAEALRDDERPKIAAVYHNRLREGWKLEADPTVAYALDKQGERLSFRDLEVDSPYNTYRARGLPPGPINCPGASSIRAAARPETGFAAMYFVADAEGGHVFSRTWSEHSEAVRAYRKKLNKRGHR